MNTPSAHGIPRRTFNIVFIKYYHYDLSTVHQFNPTIFGPFGFFIYSFSNDSGCRNDETTPRLTINLMHVQTCFTFKMNVEVFSINFQWLIIEIVNVLLQGCKLNNLKYFCF